MTPAKITHIRVLKMWESCQRTTYFVELTTDEGFTMTPHSFRTGSVYTNFEGLSQDEARDRALCTARDWADFFRMEVEPYEEDGKVHETTMLYRSYETQRILRDREAARGK